MEIWAAKNLASINAAEQRADRVLELWLEKAGVRFAYLLNSALK